MAQTSRLAQHRVRTGWLFLSPMIVVLAFVAGWPLVRTIWLSFTDARLGRFSDADFVGFENYLVNYDGYWAGVLADPIWWTSVWNTLYFTVVSVSLETILGVAIALILNASFKLRGLVRAAVLVPWAIPTIVSAQMWGWMLHDQYGIINEMLMQIGVIAAPLAWTADDQLSMWAVIFADVWKTTPFMALLALAALQMLPKDCYDAAYVDGVHPLKTFWYVTLPLIKQPLMVAVIFRSLDALRVFDVIYVLTSNSTSTMSMSIYARQQLVDFQSVGYGSAASTALFFIVALLTIMYIMLGRVRLGGEDGR
ncbi:trehalose/maltose transport system permease protein [Natronocella acetinitrilica]|uniref:Trehalose/maltose transport system permease protein n=1 Tax=Natronocella acetinitrilica TaxID=414046 RepID=A0AAE3G325_9GAMM|nr:sugar ABC transporter permease [Natronocella acetinitrilica]MCP1674896.1 trehalose/maltose transport system permease protein [Natronocella acetinitrilica]